MHRVIVYPGALPQEEDILNSNKFAMLAEGFQNRAVLGSTTVVAGLSCTPTTPVADLHVTINVGSIFQMDPIDTTAYGDLGVDTVNNIMKMGTLDNAVILSIAPPLTAGFSQVYLIQVELQDVDAGQQVLSYYNSIDETHPFSGPANSGASNFTIRNCNCTIGLKAGISATTGTQATPAPDVGFTGLFAITVSNGATQILSTNIVQLPTAPFFPTLPQVPYDVQQGHYIYAGQDTGAANAYVITFLAGQPVPTSYIAGMTVKFKAQTTNTGASTINVNGLGLVAVRRGNGIALAAADITSGGIVELTYDGTLFQMANYLGAGATTSSSTVVGIPYVVDTGTANSLIATYSPAITTPQQIAGLTIEIRLANNITGACVINVNGLGVKALTLGDGNNPPFNAFVTGEVLMLVYDGTKYQILDTSLAMFYIRPTANYTLFVNIATGSDSLYDGTSASIVGGTSSAGPFRTIQKAVNTAFNYAPSQFIITISIAAGTYTEAVATPAYAGPNLVIDGNVTASVIVSSGSSQSISVAGPNTLLVRNLTIQNSGVTGITHGFSASNGATITTQNTASNAIAGSVFLANNIGVVNLGNHNFNGSCSSCYFATVNGVIKLGGSQTFMTSIAISSATCLAGQCGQVDMGFTLGGGPTFNNVSFANGAKYNATLNGVIVAGSIGGAGNIPGSVGGSTASGGQVF